jgi:hypothetical protein
MLPRNVLKAIDLGGKRGFRIDDFSEQLRHSYESAHLDGACSDLNTSKQVLRTRKRPAKTGNATQNKRVKKDQICVEESWDKKKKSTD